MKLEEAKIEIESFLQDYFGNSYSNYKKADVVKAGDEGDGFYKVLKNAGRNGQGFELWLEKWKNHWSFSLAVSFKKKTFERYFPDYKHSIYYKQNCWDCNDGDVEEPNSNEPTFQSNGEDYYLSLYIKDGYERESIEKFFSNNDVKRVCHFSENEETERLQQSWARVGQGRYRDDMLDLWKNACSVTECSIKESLVASHAKPWRDCEPKEKTDAHNGLLLASHLDSLFDKFLITFDKNWKIKIAPGLESECGKMGITPEMSVKYDKLNEQDQMEVQKFLKYHRKKFMEKQKHD